MREVKSAHFDMDIQLKLSVIDFPIAIVGNFQAPDRSKVTITSLAFRGVHQIISIGEIEYLVLLGGEWTAITGKTPFFLHPVKIIAALQSEISDLVLVGVESLDGALVHHLKGTTPPGTFDEPGSELDVDFWIALEDARLRQVAVAGAEEIPEIYPLIGNLRELAKGPVPASLTLQLLEFNRPVSVEKPVPIQRPPCGSPTARGTSGGSASAQGVFDVEVAFPHFGLDRMVLLTHPGDSSNRLFLVLQEGCVMGIPNDESVSVSAIEVFLDIRDRVNRGGNEEGLLGLAFDPDFATNGHFYVYYSAAGPRRSVVSRFSVSQDDPNRADSGSEEVVLEVFQPYGNHNGGNILFGPDSYLYIGLGDGGSGGDPQGNGQNSETLLGAILRIDPRTPSGGRSYSVPEDNPFVGTPGFRDEIWAYGFRNPWRFSFDSETGDLWAGDVGQSGWEEIDVVVRGGNYGWNIMEGRHCFRPSRGCNQTDLELPVQEYPNPQEGCSVTGGHVYRGSRLPSLFGAYIYGDFCSGKIWALRYDGQAVTDHQLWVDSPLQISSFGQDQEGELYILSFDGRIYRLKSVEEGRDQ